jgi:hypothetical protein
MQIQTLTRGCANSKRERAAAASPHNAPFVLQPREGSPHGIARKPIPQHQFGFTGQGAAG